MTNRGVLRTAAQWASRYWKGSESHNIYERPVRLPERAHALDATPLSAEVMRCRAVSGDPQKNSCHYGKHK